MSHPGQDAIAQEDPFLYDDAEAMDEAAVNFGRYISILREWAEAEQSEEDGYA